MPGTAPATPALPLLREAGGSCGKRASACACIVAVALCTWSDIGQAAVDASQQIDASIRAHLRIQLAEQAEQQGWLNPQITYKSNPLGTARALPICNEKLQLSRLDNGNALLERQRLQLTCPGDDGWQLISLVTPSVELPVLVASTVTERGKPLLAQQFQLQQQDIAKLPRGFYQDADEVAGQIAKRRIRNGQVLTPALVAPALLVKRGQNVNMIARHGDIEASTAGLALEDGQMGQVIRVRNIASDTVIRAKVKAKGVVASQLH